MKNVLQYCHFPEGCPWRRGNECFYPVFCSESCVYYEDTDIPSWSDSGYLLDLLDGSILDGSDVV